MPKLPVKKVQIKDFSIDSKNHKKNKQDSDKDIQIREDNISKPVEVKKITHQPSKKLEINSSSDLSLPGKKSKNLLLEGEVANHFLDSEEVKKLPAKKKLLDVDQEVAMALDLDTSSTGDQKLFQSEFHKGIQTDIKKRGLLGQIWYYITSGWLVNTVIIALFLSLAFFYFDGLQPLVLKNYSSNSKALAADMNSDFENKSKTLLEAVSGLNNYPLAPTLFDVCNTNLITETETFPDLKIVSSSILPNNNFQTVGLVSVFYSSEVLDIHKDLYQKYVDTLLEYSRNLSELEGFFNYLAFRNVWIQSCQDFFAENVQNSDLIVSCQNIITIDQEYTGLLDSQSSQISSFGKVACENLLTDLDSIDDSGELPENFLEWRDSWSDLYNDLLNVNFDFDELLASVQGSLDNYRSAYQDYLQGIDNLVKKRSQIQNEFYFLNIEF